MKIYFFTMFVLLATFAIFAYSLNVFIGNLVSIDKSVLINKYNSVVFASLE